MGSIVDREREIAALRAAFARPSSLSLVYGPRRVGKTWLLQHVLRDDPDHVFFLADESTSPQLLERFRGLVAERGRGGPLWSTGAPGDWGTALTALFLQSRHEGRPLRLVLDEVPYLIAAEPALPSILQRLWDELHPSGGVHVVLSGSALGTMAALGDEGQPLHGRVDLRMKLRPFSCAEAAGFVPEWSAVDVMRLYGVFGGVARHLAAVDPAQSVDENGARAILDPLGPLHESPVSLLRTEHLSSLAEAQSVLMAVAAGENRFGAISSRTGLAGPRLDYVLRELLSLEVLVRIPRFGDSPRSRFVAYRPSDPLTRLWYRLVAPLVPLAQARPPEPLWSDRVSPRLDDHMGAVFEQIASDAVLSGHLDHDLGPLRTAAPWWSRDGRTELDLVVESEDGLLTVVECKWLSRGNVGPDALRDLQDHVARSPFAARSPRLALATAGGFTPALRRRASEERVFLWDARTLLGW